MLNHSGFALPGSTLWTSLGLYTKNLSRAYDKVSLTCWLVGWPADCLAGWLAGMCCSTASLCMLLLCLLLLCPAKSHAVVLPATKEVRAGFSDEQRYLGTPHTR